MRTWKFLQSPATFNVFGEGLIASELLQNSVDPPLKFLRSFLIKALLISSCLSRLLPPGWDARSIRVGREKKP